MYLLSLFICLNAPLLIKKSHNDIKLLNSRLV